MVDSTFINKLWEIVNKEQYQDYVGWTSQGLSFQIKNVQCFTKILLPKYFKHSNFLSFTRQLDVYGFHQSKSIFKTHQFAHKLFKRNEFQLLAGISRKSQNQQRINRHKSNQQKQNLSEKQQLNSKTTLFDNYRCMSCTSSSALFMLTKNANQQYHEQLQNLKSSKTNLMTKCQKFLESLNAQLAFQEVTNAEKGVNNINRTEKFSLEKIHELIEEVTNPKSDSNSRDIYQNYFKGISQVMSSERRKSVHIEPKLEL